MGLKINRPRRGSMGVYPRKRAASIVPRVRTWPDVELGRPVLLGFAGYKVGMAHAVLLEDRPTSPLYGKEVVRPVTILETPPLVVLGARLYGLDPSTGALSCLGEAWAETLPEVTVRRGNKERRVRVMDMVRRRIVTLPERIDSEAMWRKLEERAGLAAEVRAIVSTQPWLAGIGKKTPEVFEVPIGGVPAIEEKLQFVRGILGKEYPVDKSFEEGQLVDVVAVTKGKGWEGVVRRFGVTILPRWHKHRKGHRRTGTIGPQAPALMFTTPRPGQHGFHQRTEYNKRILRIGLDGVEVTPAGGFKHYGVVRSSYVVLQGSVPGPPKRLVIMRFPARPNRKMPTSKPQLSWISTQPLSR